MNLDFSEPRRQSSLGIIILFGDTLQSSIRTLIAPFIFLIIKLRSADIFIVFLVAMAVVFVLAIFSYLRYRNFTFMLDEQKQEFIINQGVLNKTSLTIQLNKIQQVNIRQSLIQQLIGVYSVEIDTAGSEKKEGSISAIDHDTATILKQKLLSREGFVGTEVTERSTVPFLKLSTTTLLKVGTTSNYGTSLLLLAGFVFAVFQMIHDYNKVYADDADKINFALKEGITLISLCVLLAAVLPIVLATNVIRTFVKYFKN
jgi:putative membrane protein